MTYKAASLSEAQHQTMVLKWTQQPSIRAKWPELSLMFHVPNERHCTPQQGKTLQRMGVKRGVPDLCLPVPKGRYNGLFIEMKTEAGKTTDDQEWWGGRLLAQGYMWEVCHGWESAVRVLEWYMNLKKEVI